MAIFLCFSIDVENRIIKNKERNIRFIKTNKTKRRNKIFFTFFQRLTVKTDFNGLRRLGLSMRYSKPGLDRQYVVEDKSLRGTVEELNDNASVSRHILHLSPTKLIQKSLSKTPRY